MSGLRFDLHVHTYHSPDSSLTLEQLVRDAQLTGLQGVAVTDHNTVAGVAPVREAFRTTRGFLVLPGVEVSTAGGHLLVYGVASPPPPHRPLPETLEAVAALGGVAVLAHPFRWMHGAGRRAAEGLPVAGIEAMNGRNAEVANAKAGLVAARRRIAATGGSDAHEGGSVGRCYTLVDEEVESAEAFLELLRKGRVRAEGKSQTLGGRLRISLENLAKRAGRGGAEV